MEKHVEKRYVICDEKEERFFSHGEYFVENILNADLFVQLPTLEMWYRSALSSFQRDIFCKILKVEVTVKVVEVVFEECSRETGI